MFVIVVPLLERFFLGLAGSGVTALFLSAGPWVGFLVPYCMGKLLGDCIRGCWLEGS